MQDQQQDQHTDNYGLNQEENEIMSEIDRTSIFIRNTTSGSGIPLDDFLDYFVEGLQLVVYIPRHIYSTGRVLLSDCEPGRITSVGDRFVFVQFWDQEKQRYKPGSQAVDPNDLWFRI